MNSPAAIHIETATQRTVRLRRERVTEALRGMPRPTSLEWSGCYYLSACATDADLQWNRKLLRALAEEPAHASRARVALDLLGALWAVLP